MENIFLSSVQFVSDNRFWIMPGSLVGMILAVVIDAWRNAEEVKWRI